MTTALSAHYGAVIEVCRTERLTIEIVNFLEERGHSVKAPSWIARQLREWEAAGAIRKRIGGKPKGPGRVAYWRSTHVATEPMVMARALGVDGARVAAEAMGVALPESILATPIQRASLAVERRVVEPRQLHAERAPEPEPEPAIEPSKLPTLFDASFTPDGVLISYEQFHAVIGMIEALKGGA